MAVVAERRRSALAAVLLVALIAGTARGVRATPVQAPEYRIKAAYLYYFATLIDWPQDAFQRDSDAFVLGVLGEDPFGSSLEETVRGKTVHDRSFVVRRYARARDALDSHILFVSSSERDRIAQVLEPLNGAGILTVSDSAGFTEQGGLIGLWMEGNRVRFDINLEAARQAGFRISSQLLKLGRVRDPSGD